MGIATAYTYIVNSRLIITSEYRSILFLAQTLPKDDGEFYQFVYFNDRNKMCGASSPFQFREPRNDDLVEQEVEDDILLITTNRLVLEEKLRHMELERDQLNEVRHKGPTEISLVYHAFTRIP